MSSSGSPLGNTVTGKRNAPEHSSDVEDDDGMAEYRSDEKMTRRSVDNRDSNAIKHFDFYMINFRKIDKFTIVNIPLIMVNENLINGWYIYLGKDAKKYCDNNMDRISHHTADNYASGIKSIFFSRCLKEKLDVPAVFNDKNAKKYRTKLLSMYVEDSLKTGRQLSEPHVAATQQDRIASSMCCVWNNSLKAAEFMHLNNSKYMYTGRGSEIALAKHKHVT